MPLLEKIMPQIIDGLEHVPMLEIDAGLGVAVFIHPEIVHEFFHAVDNGQSGVDRVIRYINLVGDQLGFRTQYLRGQSAREQVSPPPRPKCSAVEQFNYKK